MKYGRTMKKMILIAEWKIIVLVISSALLGYWVAKHPIKDDDEEENM